jgi:hypothetical protein
MKLILLCALGLGLSHVASARERILCRTHDNNYQENGGRIAMLAERSSNGGLRILNMDWRNVPLLDWARNRNIGLTVNHTIERQGRTTFAGKDTSGRDFTIQVPALEQNFNANIQPPPVNSGFLSSITNLMPHLPGRTREGFGELRYGSSAPVYVRCSLIGNGRVETSNAGVDDSPRGERRERVRDGYPVRDDSHPVRVTPR